jgi:hypothetical protein
MKTTARTLFILAAVLASAASGWNYEYSWYDPAANTSSLMHKPGAGGNMGTGGLRDARVRCDHCHNPLPTGARIGATVTFNPPLTALPDGGRRYASQPYDVTVTMTGEHVFNPDGGPSANGFAGRFELGNGAPAGTVDSDTAGLTHSPCLGRQAVTSLGSLPGTTVVYQDCEAVLHREKLGISAWSFKWNAPPTSAGPVTFFYGVVDGAGNDRSRNSDGGFNDDVKYGSVRLSP